MHDIKILITVSFTNCYCYKNECRNNIFSGNKLYSHFFFFFKSQEKNLSSGHWQKNQSLKEVFCRRAPVRFCKVIHTGQQTLTSVFVSMAPQRSLCSQTVLMWQHSFPREKTDKLENSTVLVHMWSFPV